MANAPHYPKGRYVGKILNQALGKAGTGNPQLVIQIKVLGKPDPLDPGSYIPDPHQYERTVYRTITEKTVPYIIEDLKALGVSIQSWKQLDPSTPGFVDLRGNDADFFCNHEASQDGGVREKWGIAMHASEFKVETLEPAKMRELDNLFGKQLKEAFKPGAAPKTQAQPAIATMEEGVSDDDIPF